MYYLPDNIANIYMESLLESRRDYSIPRDSYGRRRDSLGHALCPVTSEVFMQTGWEELICSSDSYSLHNMLITFSWSNIASRLLQAMYPEHSNYAELSKMQSLFCLERAHELLLSHERYRRFKNVLIRISETVYNNGIAFTFVSGKTENQVKLFQYCDFYEELDDDTYKPKLSQKRLFKFMYQLYEQALFDVDETTSTTIVARTINGEVTLTREALARYINVFVAYALDCTKPIRHVVLKGVNILNAYSDVYSHTSSCMQNCAPSVFLNYIANPDTIRIIVGLTASNKIVTRRLIYKLQSGDWYAGRLYYSEGKYKETASDLFKPLREDTNLQLTFPTYGDDDYPAFMKKYDDKYNDDFKMYGYESNTGKMEECLDLYKLPPIETFEDVVYNFIDMTADECSAGGEALKNPRNNYRAAFKMPFTYIDLSVYRNYRYFDDISGVLFGDSIKVIVDERDSKCTYLDSVLALSFLKGSNRNATTHLDAFMNDVNNGWCLGTMDIERLARLRDEANAARMIGVGTLCNLLDTLDLDSDDEEFVLWVEQGDGRNLRLVAKSLLDMSNYIYLGGALYVAKNNIVYMDNGEYAGAYLCSKNHPHSSSTIRVNSLQCTNPLTNTTSDIEDAGITNIDLLFPRYTELCSIAGVEQLEICNLRHGYRSIGSKFTDCGIFVPTQYGTTPVPIRKNLVTTTQVFNPVPRLTHDTALFSYSTVNFPTCLNPTEGLVQLSPELYGDNQYSLPDQVVMSNHGYIYKVHARRLSDGTIVHKEAYNAIKILDKFNMAAHCTATITPIKGSRVC